MRRTNSQAAPDGQRVKETYEVASQIQTQNQEGKMEQRIKGTTGLLALIGSPVGHSGSPDMYNFCFRYHNLDYSYMAFDIKEDQVPAALDAMRLFKMRGCNVTMPCKTAAAQNMDELSPAARIIGAVNTIVNENGKTDRTHDRWYRFCGKSKRSWCRCKRKENW